MSLGFGLMLAFQVVLALFLVVIILLQQGKGATAGASFGAGASSTVFGSRGSASFLSSAGGTSGRRQGRCQSPCTAWYRRGRRSAARLTEGDAGP